jgi:hypothetical protein
MAGVRLAGSAAAELQVEVFVLVEQRHWHRWPQRHQSLSEGLAVLVSHLRSYVGHLVSPMFATAMRMSVCQPVLVWYENSSRVAVGVTRCHGLITEYQKLKVARRSAVRGR